MPIILRVKGFGFWFYEADLDEPPLDSQLTFPPADFF